MGLFSDVLTAITPTKAKLQNVFDVLSIAINPFSKDKIVANTPNATANTLLQAVANHPYTTAAVAVGGITAIKSPTAAVNAVKSLLPTSAAGKIATIASVPIIAGAVSTAPAQALNSALSAPSALANFGANVAKVAANPTIAGAKAVFTENPVVSGLAAGAAAIAIGAGATGIIASLANTSAVRENTKATTGLIPTPAYYEAVAKEQQQQQQLVTAAAATPPVSSSASKPVGNATAASPQTPVLPLTQSVSATTQHRRRSHVKRARIASQIQQTKIFINTGRIGAHYGITR